ncbi:hypothetical protein JCM15457_986 [Liquorilactobacillus sucicola DSM 21376 = JCM 15457]|uniref:Uncharacterized protein n=2 Tax=Liquorilactobacillus sucicola TaxID=519050 RepID=A0A023CX24_9LACO|nr:hypothetical protein FD15_GL001346 [Liquorilactobacillus sucicola DSM 21376 = JCM 15457]GAJ26075.1 hypothetical protein JCM15457_986 [Liquorilactobacillus sucicola DSM 21376 = JCM 15457]
MMGIFNNNKIKGILVDRGLDDISSETSEQIEAILGELDNKNLLRNDKRLLIKDRSDDSKISYLRALVEQNWILIAQNDKIIKLLAEKEKTNAKR